MSDYDRLPPELRRWLRDAALPWSPRSVRRLWQKSIEVTSGDTNAALARLSQAEAASLARDARAVWGADHPAAAPTTTRRDRL